MNVVDSSARLEYLTGSERAGLFAEPIEKTGSLIVPVIVVCELFKKVYRERSEDAALEVYGLLAQGTVVDIDTPLALAAARIRLPLADSLIYATTQFHQVTLWTQDEQFQGMAGVKYFPKEKEGN